MLFILKGLHEELNRAPSNNKGTKDNLVLEELYKPRLVELDYIIVMRIYTNYVGRKRACARKRKERQLHT